MRHLTLHQAARRLLAVAAVVVACGCAAPSEPAPTSATSPAPRVTVAEPSPAPPVSRTVTGCVTNPSRCGYPDETNTGVPRGVTLRPSESVTAARDGQVIDGLDVTGEINVEADNVVIKNSRVTGGRGAGNADWVIVMRPGARHLTITDSELRTPPGSAQDIACLLNIGDGLPTLLRVDIHGCSAGVSSGGGLVADSYVHDMAEVAGLSHDVGVASNGGGGMTVRHNTILNQLGQTAAVAFYQDFSVQRNNLIEDNLVAGGGYCLYGGAGQRGPTRNIRFLDNRLSKKFFGTCGAYGVVASFSVDDPGNRFAGNYWDETGHDVEFS